MREQQGIQLDIKMQFESGLTFAACFYPVIRAHLVMICPD